MEWQMLQERCGLAGPGWGKANLRPRRYTDFLSALVDAPKKGPLGS